MTDHILIYLKCKVILARGCLVFLSLCFMFDMSHASGQSPFTQYSIHIILPDVFMKQVEHEQINLLEKMFLEGCQEANFTFSAHNLMITSDCEQRPSALIITGFHPIYYFTEKKDTIIFNPKTLIIDIRIATETPYYFLQDFQKRIVSNDQILSVSYNEIRQPLSFYNIEENDNLLKKSISLKEVLQGQATLSLQSQAVLLQTRINYNKNYTIFQFADKKSCRNERNFKKLSLYTQTDIANVIIAEESQYLKIFNDLGAPISRCLAVTDFPQELFTPYQCPGKRRLIVIAMGESLNQYSTLIKSVLNDVFKAQLNAKIPFTIVTILPGRELSVPLLTCEEMADVDDTEISHFMRDKFKSIRFGAQDLKSLEDLELINTSYPNDQLERIFYITDNSHFPPASDTEFCVPRLSWQNIKLTVFTTGSCIPWIKKAHAQCETLSTEEKLQQALQHFLTEY